VWNLGRIRFAESESRSRFRLDLVNPSILFANPNPDSRIYSESSFDVDSLAKPELNSNITNKRITMTPLPTTSTNPDHSVCPWIQIQIQYESESGFGQIEYGPSRWRQSCGQSAVLVCRGEDLWSGWVLNMEWKNECWSVRVESQRRMMIWHTCVRWCESDVKWLGWAWRNEYA